MQENLPYEDFLSVIFKWSSRLKMPITWKEASVCEFFDNCQLAKDYILPDGGSLNSSVNAFTTVPELIEIFHSMAEFQKELERQKNDSPNWEDGRMMYIRELERELEQKETIFESSEYKTNRESLKYLAFRDISMGKSLRVLDYADYLIPDDIGSFLDFRLDSFRFLVRGAALAHLLPALRDEAGIENNYKQPGTDVIAKFTWTGTTGELGYIIDLLMEKGYIENIPTASRKAAVALNSFRVITNRNRPASVGTLRNCFDNGGDKKDLQMRIPISETFGKS
jgi:hypothetical protein